MDRYTKIEVRISDAIENKTERNDDMTINMGYFEELRKAILSAGLGRVVEIKKELAEKTASWNYTVRNGEDPTGGWNLYLDALCDLRLGAFAWDGSRIISFGAGELDMLADWYELLCEVARSVNRRQKDGRGGCNESKFSALEDFVRARKDEIGKSVSTGNEYARYLVERTEQVNRMKEAENWSSLAKIEAFRGK